MRSTLKTMAFAGVLALGGLAMLHASARADCGGGPSGGPYGGRSGAGYYGGRSGGSFGGGCARPGMSMPGMNVAGYGAASQALPAYSPAAYPQAAPQPTAVGIQYTCPMHPSVVSGAPGSCPYCHMALQRR